MLWRLLLTALLLLPRHTQADSTPTFQRSWTLKTQAIPTSLTELGTLAGGTPAAGASVAVCQLDISVAPNQSVNITIQDNQATPGVFFNAVPITAASATQGLTYQVIRVVPVGASADGCKVFWNGLTIQASGTGAMIAMAGRW